MLLLARASNSENAEIMPSLALHTPMADWRRYYASMHAEMNNEPARQAMKRRRNALPGDRYDADISWPR